MPTHFIRKNKACVAASACREVQHDPDVRLQDLRRPRTLARPSGGIHKTLPPQRAHRILQGQNIVASPLCIVACYM